MIKLSQGKIKLEDVIVDISTFNVRAKVTEQDLETHYSAFIEHVGEAKEYFEDKKAFDRAVQDAAEEKRPKLIPREPRYPSMWGLKPALMPFGFLRPSERRLHDQYFIAAHCITAIPKKTAAIPIVNETKVNEPLDMKLREYIIEKFKRYPGYEGIIEIPNDRTMSETKSTTFHEALHYVISRYQAETGRTFVSNFIKEELSQLERYQAEHIIHEGAVEVLTDKLLTHDPDAQFEARWLSFSLHDKFRHGVMTLSAIATGILLGTSITQPYLLPAALIPGRIRDYITYKHKQSKRKEILKPIEYPQFKI